MSLQIAVRIPDELAEFVDGEVRAGRAQSRSELVLRSLERERRHRQALADVAILSDASSSRDLDPLVAHAAATRLELD